MTEKENSPAVQNRLNWMDNLRTVIILLVVLYHVGGVYEAAGLWGWFWIVDDPDTITWVGILGIVFDIFVMPAMFFISGYLIPASLKSKTGWDFLKGKIKRLMLPWMIAVFTLIPVYKIIFLYSRNLPQEHWSTYFHFTNPNSQNWLWFLPVLFAFNIIYLIFSKSNIRIPDISIKKAVWGTFLIVFLYSYGIGGILDFRSWTLTPLIDFENERLLIYFMTFLLGSLFFKQKIFMEKTQNKKVYTIASSIIWVPITFHIFGRLLPFFFPDSFSFSPLYRAFWWLSFDLSLLFLLYLMIETFRRYFDHTGKIWTELNRNSYGVYIIHVIGIGIFGNMLLNLNLPALVKYPFLFILTYLFSNMVVSVYRSLIQNLKSRAI
ncbi:acyltransferase [bacterium]|nr:acyltransferase [bacterium]